NLPRWKQFNGFQVWPFPFGQKVKPRIGKKGTDLHIALIHQYNWVPGAVYSDTPKGITGHVDASRDEFKNYDLVVSGDNHIPFEKCLDIHFINCGGFMIRKSNDEWNPVFWLLYDDGSVQAVRHDISQDKHIDTEQAHTMEEQPDFDLTSLIDGLGKLGTDLIDVRQAFLRTFRGESGRRMKMLLKAMEE
ncbi:MAG: hypothetical protein FJY85_18655, partial [Deltaproteobacteria bacterium]|nr:hypothetical protein [Deltaproteobacteria bacterium]